MTEPFKTPEPSDAAWYAAEKAMEGCPQGESPSRHAIAAGMAIDAFQKYLAERFGFPEAAPERVCAGCTPVSHGVKFIKGCPVHDPLPPPEPSGNAGLDSPPGTGSPSSNAAEKAASGRARGEDATTPPAPSAGAKRVPQNIIDAIGKYGTECRNERYIKHDLFTLAAWEKLIDEIRPLVPTPSGGEPLSRHDFINSFDARVWAKAFVETVAAYPRVPTDEGAMIGWFANALMRGFDEHARQHPDPTTTEPVSAGETKLADLHGIAPNLTGGKGSVEFVREMRDQCECEDAHVLTCPYYRPSPTGSPAVGARPEGERCRTFDYSVGLRCFLSEDHEGKCRFCDCTAYACERCENERAFLRIVAELHLDSQKDHRDSKRNAIFHRLVAAARKVVE